MSRYYTAELVLALEYLRSKCIVHRDLKPENILFDHNFHILVTDFGSGKIVNDSGDPDANAEPPKRRNSFVGTAEYVSPEMLQESKSSYASDLWALGCIVFHMASGIPPFKAGSEYLIFQKVLKLDYTFPDGFDERVKDFVEKLLVVEPGRRLGAQDVEPYTTLREHEMFYGVNWNDLGPPPKLSNELIDDCSRLSGSDISLSLEPGLNSEQVSRLVLKEILSEATQKVQNNLMDITQTEIQTRLEAQESNTYHQFVEGNLILKQGLIDKRKGLFPRRRMFLLTLGPHLYYVDPVTMTLKGEIPWSKELKTEAKNFKTFFIHTVSFRFHSDFKCVY